MLPLFTDTRLLDAAAKSKYNLTDDILMENAAGALQKVLANIIEETCTNFSPNQQINVLIVCGSGDNGGDGWCLARRLNGESLRFNYAAGAETYIFSINPVVYEAKPAKSPSCIAQKNRAILAGVQCVPGLQPFVEEQTPCHIVVDCLFGSGFTGAVEQNYAQILNQLNRINAAKIACDMPSGLASLSDPNLKPEEKCAFIAEKTVTMGALKTALYDDSAKDYCGEIICAGLGISEKNFLQNAKADAFLLQKSDLMLPVRTKQNVHKGTFGHALIACGVKTGAGVLASSAAYGFGAGLVTLFCSQNPPPMLPLEVMYNNEIPKNVTAFACGMGLGKGQILEEWAQILSANPNAACILDADFFYYSGIEKLLAQRSRSKQTTVLTPHPKEFAVLLANCGMGEYTNSQIQSRRFELASQFCHKYPDIVLLLKGANPIIACKFSSDEQNLQNFYAEKTAKTAYNCGYAKDQTLLLVNSFGSACLAKGGTGDVLSGLICALLAQGYSALDAAASASLAHAMAGSKIKCTYGLTAQKLIDAVQTL